MKDHLKVLEGPNIIQTSRFNIQFNMNCLITWSFRLFFLIILLYHLQFYSLISHAYLRTSLSIFLPSPLESSIPFSNSAYLLTSSISSIVLILVLTLYLFITLYKQTLKISCVYKIITNVSWYFLMLLKWWHSDVVIFKGSISFIFWFNDQVLQDKWHLDFAYFYIIQMNL